MRTIRCLASTRRASTRPAVNPAGRRRSALLVTVNLAAAAIYFIHLGHGIGLGGYRIDLDVYRTGAGVLLHGGDLYGRLPRLGDGHELPFTYPPFAALTFIPLTLIGYTAANWLLTAVTIVCVAVSLWCFATSTPGEAGARMRLLLPCALPAALLLEPIRSTLTYGQINALLMALVAFDCLTRAPRWPRGMGVGVAAALKLTPAVFLLFFLLRRDLRSAARAGLSFAACTGAGFALAPHDSLRYWTRIAYQPARAGGISYASNQSLLGILARLGLGNPTRTWLWLALCLLVVALTVTGMRGAIKTNQVTYALSLNAVAGLLISPISWSHHWVWAAPALLTCLATTSPSRRRPPAFAVLALLTFAIAPHWLLPSGGGRELHWSWWQQAVGDSYALIGLAALTRAAVKNLLPRPKREGPGTLRTVKARVCGETATGHLATIAGCSAPRNPPADAEEHNQISGREDVDSAPGLPRRRGGPLRPPRPAPAGQVRPAGRGQRRPGRPVRPGPRCPEGPGLLGGGNPGADGRQAQRLYPEEDPAPVPSILGRRSGQRSGLELLGQAGRPYGPFMEYRLAAAWERIRTANPYVVDGALAAFCGGTTYAALVGGAPLLAAHPPNGVAWFLASVQTVALVWRRRWPVTVYGVVAATGFAYDAFGFPVNGALGFLLALYTVAAYGSRRASAVSAVVAGVGLFIILLRFYHVTSWVTFLQGAFQLGFGWILGEAVRTRRAYASALQERSARREREREEQTRRAVADERASIARELHDVVAHNVSVMVIQAGANRVSPPIEPSKAIEAFASIENIGRQALTETRRLLGLMRREGERLQSPCPQPGLEHVGALVDQVRSAGLPATMLVEGDARPLPPGLNLSAYRIVQEALTNVLKHAGPTPTQVLIHYGDRDLEVRVTDQGQCLPAAGEAAETGHGLIGMRERVMLYGGQLDAGPLPGGGYAVRACLPLEARR